MENYFLKSSLSLLILYGLYSAVIRYEFNHQLNRFLGIGCILFSLVFPFIQIVDLPASGYLPGTFYVVAKETGDIKDGFASAVPDNTINILAIVYAIGASVLLLRSLGGLATLFRLYRSGRRSRRWGFTVVTVKRELSPFTFFNVLFMGNAALDTQELDTMLLHERTHREQHHSIDSLLLEVLTIAYWFNPVIWLFQRDIKAQHEYFADRRVLQTGIDPFTYQLMLFKARTGALPDLGNHFSAKTSLIKRFNMMTSTKLKSPGSSYLRVALFPALIACMLFLSAFSVDNAQEQGDKAAVYAAGQEAMYQHFKRHIRYPQSARRENRTGLVKVAFTVNANGDVVNIETDEAAKGHLLSEIVITGYATSSASPKGVDEILKDECVRVVKSFGKFIPAERNGEPVSSVLVLPIKFNLN